MISFAALNKEDSVGSLSSTHPLSSSGAGISRGGRSSNPTKEAQESAILQLYHAALKKQQEGELIEAEDIYRDVLDSALISPICPSADEMGNTLYRVKFLILKNVASIAKELNDTPRAISAYLEASEYCQEDSTLFYQLALSSVSLGDLPLARETLEQVLHINSRYWPAITLLCRVLLAIGDYLACVEVVLTAIEINPLFTAADGLIHHCLSVCPELLSINPLLTKYLFKSSSSDADKLIEESRELRVKYRALSDVTVLTESVVPPTKLTSISIERLGQFLISVYNHCKTIARKHNRPTMSVSVDLYTVLDGVKENDHPPVAECSPVKKPSLVQSTITIKDAVNDVSEKRKRRLFSDTDGGYQPKRRSTRSKGSLVGGVRRDHHDYLRIINKYLPQVYRLEILPDASEVIEVPDVARKITSGHDDNVASVGVLEDVSEVRLFIEESIANKCSIITLLFNYLWLLSSNYYKIWSNNSAKVFIECYELVFRHLSFPSPFSQLSNSHIQREEARKLYLISLCYVELVLDHKLNFETSSNIHHIHGAAHPKKKPSLNPSHLSAPFTESMVFLRYMSLIVLENDHERAIATLRVHWAKIKMSLLKKEYEATAFAIDECIQLLEEAYKMKMHSQSSHDQMSYDQPVIVQLPNCSSDNVISIDKLADKRNQITRSTSLKNVFSLYEENKYNDVIDVLIPILKQEIGSHSPFFLTHMEGDTPPSDAQPSVKLLLDSLINVNRIKDAFVYCIQCVLEILVYYSIHGASDSFISALAFNCRTLTHCLETDSSILSQLEYKVVQNFIICLIKIIDLSQDSVDAFTLPDDVYVSPWKLLYNVLSCQSLPTDDKISMIDEIDSPIARNNEMDQEVGVSEPIKTTSVDTEDTKPMEGEDNVPLDEGKGSHDPVIIDKGSPVDTQVNKTIVEPMDTCEHVVSSLSPIDPPSQMVDNSRSPLLDPPSPPLTTVTTDDHTSPNKTDHCYTTSTAPLSSSLPSSNRSSPCQPHPDNSQETPPSPLQSFPSSTNVSVSPMISTRESPFKSRTVSPLFDDTDRKETSLRFLQQAHSLLGSFGLCAKDNGSFLIFILSILHKELRGLTALSKELREILLVELEQCYYCLYGYPYKKAKSRGLTEHNADQIPLSWDRAVVLLEYFHPSYLPAVDESKSPQVTSELITLYKKIIEVVPEDEAVISKVSLSEYINGTLTSLPQLNDDEDPHPHSSLIGEIYYLIADDYLRSLDNLVAIKHYQCSILYRPNSFDTWAGLAIGLSQRITEDKINQRDEKKTTTIEKFVERKTPLAIRYFTRAMELISNNCYLVEKFGFFLYAVHSFMAQIMQQPLLYTSKTIRGWAKLSLNDMLVLADKQFDLALTLTGSKHYEPWIYQFMLGKISMKLNRQPQAVLQHFVKATDVLHAEGATYPVLVEVASKGHAIQAIEVHYHFLSVLLKMILLSTDSHDNSVFSRMITNMRNYPLGRITYESLWNWAVGIVGKYRNTNDESSTEKHKVEDKKAMEEKDNDDETKDVPADDTTPQSHDSHEVPPPLVLPPPLLCDDHVIPPPPPPLSCDDHVIPPPPLSCDDHVIPLPPPPPLSSQLFSGLSQLTESDLNWQNTDSIDHKEQDILPMETETNANTSTANNECTRSSHTPYDGTIIKEGPPDNDGSHSLSHSSDEGQLILVDGDSSCSGVASSPDSTNHDTSAIELVAQSIGTESSRPDPMSRFSNIIPDPLTEAVYGVAMCAVRFPAYFKPLYRLASTLQTMGYPHEAKKFLLGPIPSCFTEIQEKLVPIFALRTNIYQNMWQIRIPEINRPGNFSTHARRCLELLIDVLRDTNELSSLVYITQQLKARVDPSKQYMRESVRQSMYIRSLLVCVDVLKNSNTSESSDGPSCVVKMLMDAYSIRNMIIKSELKNKEDLLKDTETCMMKHFTDHWNYIPPHEMVFPEKTISFDACLKFCQIKIKQ